MLGLALIIWSFYWAWHQPAPKQFQSQIEVTDGQSFLNVGDKIIPVEIADTDPKRELGLSNRESLKEGNGLLFIFPVANKYGFWMKDMKFPIDIVWIDENWRVVGVEKEVNPDSYPKVFYSTSNVRYVLELNAGDALSLGIDTTSVIFFNAQK